MSPCQITQFCLCNNMKTKSQFIENLSSNKCGEALHMSLSTKIHICMLFLGIKNKIDFH